MSITPTHQLFCVKKKLFDLQPGKTKKHINIIFLYLLAQMILNLFN